MEQVIVPELPSQTKHLQQLVQERPTQKLLEWQLIQQLEVLQLELYEQFELVVGLAWQEQHSQAEVQLVQCLVKALGQLQVESVQKKEMQ